MADRRYSREEVDAILGRALRAQHDETGLTHEELVAAAKEVGVSSDQIEHAATDVLDGREIEQKVSAHMKRRWRGFAWHLAPYLLVMAFLVFVNVMTTSYPWVLWPAAGWGLGLAMHAMGLLMGDPEKIARKIRKREQRRVRDRVRVGRDVRVKVEEDADEQESEAYDEVRSERRK